MTERTKRVAGRSIIVRAVGRDSKGSVDTVIEQEIPRSNHQIGLLLRRDPFRETVVFALLTKGTVTFEVKP